MKNRHLRKLLLLGSVFALPLPVSAATLKVGIDMDACGGTNSCDHINIQDAIDAAASGDEVRIYPGTYSENLVIDSTVPEISILRQAGEVIVDGGGINPALKIDGDHGEGLYVGGLTLKNGRGVLGQEIGLTTGRYFGGGVFVRGSSPTLDDLVVKENTANNGAGIFLMRSSPVVRNSRIDSNVISATNPGGGGGIFLHQGSNPLIEDSTVSNNTGAIRGGGVYGLGGVQPQMVGVNVRGNSAGYGGGLYFITGSSVDMTGSLIVGNASTATTTATTPPGGGGVYLYEGVQANFTNVTLADNVLPTGVSDGVELYSMGSMARFFNSVVTNAVSTQSSKSLIFGYNMPSGGSRPGITGAEARYSNIYSAAASRFAGTYSESTVVKVDDTSAAAGFVGGGSGPGLSGYSYELDGASDSVDAGDPEAFYNDVDNSRNDQGAYGGPLPLVELAAAFDDADADGMADAWEEHYFTTTGAKDGSLDTDADGLLDREEYEAGTDPARADTDRDGWSDSAEIDAGSNPTDAADHQPRLVVSRDRIAVVGTELVTLSAANTVDPDGTAMSYAWSLVSKPVSSAVTVSGVAVSTSFTPDVAGVYEVRITVTDASGAAVSKVVRVYAGAEVTVTAPELGGGGTLLYQAIQAAAPYTTITVGNGSYARSSFDFAGKTIRIRSANGPGVTSLVGTGTGSSVVTFTKGEGAASSLEGFTISGGFGSTVGGYTTAGGVLIQGASPTLSNLVISYNRAAYGAGMAILNGSPYISNVTFDNNVIAGATVTPGAGAGVYIYGGSPEFKDCSLTNNRLYTSNDLILGGGMFIYGANVRFEGSGPSSMATIDANRGRDGGGIYVGYGASLAMRYVTVEDNIASSGGGGIFGYSRPTITIADSIFRRNNGTLSGGAIYLSEVASLVISDSEIGQAGNGNSAANGGGIASYNGAHMRISGVSFRANSADRAGAILHGAADQTGQVGTSITGSLFEDNVAATVGGAISLDNGAVASIVSTRMIDNTAGTDGGAVYLNAGESVSLRNCLMTGNQAARGGAVFATHSTASVSIINNTMVGNSASSMGSAALSMDNAAMSIANSIVSHSSGPGINAVEGVNDTVTVTYSAFYSNSANMPVSGVVSSNTLVADPMYTTYAGDPDSSSNNYRLRYLSTLINAGDPTVAHNDVNATRNDLGFEGGPYGVSVDYDADDDGLADEQEAALGSNPNDTDSDDDGLTDQAEFVAGTSPIDADSDDDLLDDPDEITEGTDPLDPDSDSDAVEDGDEVLAGTDPLDSDSDDDGRNDGQEATAGTNPMDSDSDDDGRNDGQEATAGTDPLDSDSDNDGRNDGQEFTAGTDPLDSDSDDDGRSDGQEATAGTNPLDSDSDDDGRTDGQEATAGTNPLNADSDADGVSDGAEATAGTNPLNADSDADGVTDGAEATAGTNPLDTDSDDDGRTDGQEVTAGTNALDSDSDDDGLTDGAEATAGTNPLSADSDTDGVNDGAEATAGTDPMDMDSDDDGQTDGQEATAGTNPLSADSDSDGRTDGQEVTAGTNPLDADSDDDGRTDGQEATAGTNPLLSDTDTDGLTDGQEATLGSNPLDTDSDDDGLNDWQDQDAGLNALSADSDNDGTADAVEASGANRPVATAGMTRACAVDLPCVVEGVDGGDPNSDAITYAWSVVTLPNGATAPTLTGGTSFRASFTPTVAGTYVLALRSLDGNTQSAASNITVYVRTPEVVGADADYSTIQAALDAVTSGSLGSYPVIVVEPGTYRERLTMPSVPFTLMSRDGAATTIIDADTDNNGTGNGVAVTFTSSQTGVWMKGFTVRMGANASNSTSYGGGIKLMSSNARVEDCILRSNTAYRGGAVHVSGGAPVLLRNRIIHNSSTHNAGAVYVQNATGLRMWNNFIVKNTTGNQGAIYSESSTIQLYFNTLAGNAAAGVSTLRAASSAVDMRNNLVAYEPAVGSVSISTDAGTVIKNNVFWYNRGYNIGGTYTDSASQASDNKLGTVTSTSPSNYDPKVVVFTSGTSNNAMKDDLRLKTGSSGLDYAAGLTPQYKDIDGSSPDVGFFGGPHSESRQRINRVKVSGASSDEYSTIATGIQYLIAGDEAHAYAGTYNEVVNFAGKNIALKGGYGGETILDGTSKSNAVVTFLTGETSAALLSGFTIQNGIGLLGGSTRLGGGIFISGSSPTIQDCVVKNNSAHYGGGVYVNNSTAQLLGLTVRNNAATTQGGGMYFTGAQVTSLDQSVIALNTSASKGGGVMIEQAPVSIENTLVQLNTAANAGGGISTNLATATLTNLVVIENSAGAGTRLGGGLYMNQGNMTLKNTIVAYNQERGILANGSHSLLYCDFYSNHSNDYITFSGSFTTTGVLTKIPGFTAYDQDGVVDDDFSLMVGSQLINVGDPAILDADGSRSDIGLYGGPGGDF